MHARRDEISKSLIDERWLVSKIAVCYTFIGKNPVNADRKNFFTDEVVGANNRIPTPVPQREGASCWRRHEGSTTGDNPQLVSGTDDFNRFVGRTTYGSSTA